MKPENDKQAADRKLSEAFTLYTRYIREACARAGGPVALSRALGRHESRVSVVLARQSLTEAAQCAQEIEDKEI